MNRTQGSLLPLSKWPRFELWTVNLTWKMTETLQPHQECFHKNTVLSEREATLYLCLLLANLIAMIESLIDSLTKNHTRVASVRMKVKVFILSSFDIKASPVRISGAGNIFGAGNISVIPLPVVKRR